MNIDLVALCSNEIGMYVLALPVVQYSNLRFFQLRLGNPAACTSISHLLRCSKLNLDEPWEVQGA